MTDRPFIGFVPREGEITLESVLDFPAQFIAYARRLAGEEIELQIRKRRTKRSDRQNRALHSLLGEWAREGGHTIDDLKDDLLREVFGTREVVNPITGEVRLALAEPHTSTLDTAKFAHLMDETLRIAAECGVVLEAPDEFKVRKAAEAKAAARAQRKGKAA